ncbi:MAG TPA: hypothetical protein VIM96_10720 [Pseudomonadales bacterium]
MTNEAEMHDFWQIKPIDIMAGLASAERPLLAVSLALFEDAKLQKKISELWGGAKSKLQELSGQELHGAVEGVRYSMQEWLDSGYSDDHLRLLLWIYLREALKLPARIGVSLRSISFLAEDVAAATISFVDKDQEGAVTLGEIVTPAINELFEKSIKQGDAKKLINDVRGKFENLSEGDQKSMLENIGANELSDEAIKRMLLTGGGLASFGAAVSLGGFSSYILAAQASAFIPFVSGPGLVSLVAVLANPITIITVTGAAFIFGKKSVDKKMQGSVAVHVLALLSLQAKSSGNDDLLSLVRAFSQIGKLKVSAHLEESVIEAYKKEWKLLAPAIKKEAFQPSAGLLNVMGRPVLSTESFKRRWSIFPGKEETHNAAILAGLTIGDALYSICALNPEVLKAADFSRSADIDGAMDFAAFSNEVLSKTGESLEGAIANLKGYTAEQLVGAQLMGQGHVVSFPESSNQPGYDLVVDGQPVQVKFHEDMGGLNEHFDKYDYPVYANSELAGEIPDEMAGNVFFIDGLSDELVNQVTRQSLESGSDILDPSVPMFAMMISAGRHFIALESGRITAQQAVEQVMIDGSVRAGLALAGKTAGLSIGMLVFGPAGALVLGSSLPILAQAQAGSAKKRIRSALKTEEIKEWEECVHDALNDLQKSLKKGLDSKSHEIDAKYDAIDPDLLVGEYVRWRLFQDKRFLYECRRRLKSLSRKEIPDPEQRAVDTIRWLTGVVLQPAYFQDEIRELNLLLKDRPGTADAYIEMGKEGVEKLKGWWLRRQHGNNEA